MNNLPDTTPIETEYVEYNCMQPHEFTCPKCKNRFYSDVPQITIICKCGAELIRKDFAKSNVFAKGRRLTPLALDGGDSAPSQAVSKPFIFSGLVALFKPTHRK